MTVMFACGTMAVVLLASVVAYAVAPGLAVLVFIAGAVWIAVRLHRFAERERLEETRAQRLALIAHEHNQRTR